jgi:predicted amidophosphoribosyltransferase
MEPVLEAKRFVPPFHLREGMSASDRAEAIKGAFGVAEGSRLEGRTVCIIDDVTTTGATLGEARRALQAAGAGRIMAGVVAKTSRLAVLPAGLDQPGKGV